MAIPMIELLKGTRSSKGYGWKADDDDDVNLVSTAGCRVLAGNETATCDRQLSPLLSHQAMLAMLSHGRHGNQT